MDDSVALRTRIELVLPAFFAATGRLWGSADLRAGYRAYLCALHGVIRASVPLMQAALAEAERRGTGDPVAPGLAAYLRRHIPEERGHDEWVRQDLAAIGADPDEPARRMPPPAIAALVGAQYYWIFHHHPVCLLGYISVLEGYPPTPELAEHVMRETGFPKTGLRTMIRHSVIDQRHRDELLAVFDGLPLTGEQLSAIGLSAISTVRGLITVFDELAPPGAPAPVPAAAPALVRAAVPAPVHAPTAAPAAVPAGAAGRVAR